MTTLSSLEGTEIAAAARYATTVNALVAGGSPAPAAVIIMVPFFFAEYIGIDMAYYLGWAIGFVELFFLGMFLGHVSRERLIVSGLKLVLAGGVALGLSLLLNVAGL